MVKVKDEEHILSDGSIDLESWLGHLGEQHKYADIRLIRNACVLSQLAGQDQPTESGESCLQQGLAMAEILVDLDMDQETIAAAIVYDSVQYSELTIEDVYEQLGSKVGKLVHGVERMSAINNMHGLSGVTVNHQQVDNVRKMLLAMVDDVRVVLIKLAERLRVLRTVAHLSESVRQQIAKETMEIYAPLANRLGIGHIKWEMEDYSFRYLQPEKYKEIAKGLNSRRVDRDKYVENIVAVLNKEIANAGVSGAKVYGRSKHIHSIYRKMQRKNIDLSEIYDATAVRVLVPKLDDCYTALSVTHNLWEAIPAEFDDYINNPKPNGYRSLHTAVFGPEGRSFEVQIRTFQMHDEAELGVAAHWKYKEGEAGGAKASHERKIAWLREVLEWQHEVAQDNENIEELSTDFLEERVYIFTPKGEIIDLPKGSTPLDFAYHIHSEVGHRCRGAKVDGSIVPLTHQLETGEQVDILTGKQPQPSRDWLNPNLGYLKSSRAKAKIHHYFKLLEYDQNRTDGLHIMERELKKLSLKNVNFDTIAKQLNFKKGDDMLAALGRGDMRTGQIIAKLAPVEKGDDDKIPVAAPERSRAGLRDNVHIHGVGNLLTHMARCCKPVPGDAIIGYITLGRGISIHRNDCNNILYANDNQQQRLIEVTWGEQAQGAYQVDVVINAYDRHGLLKDITTILTNEKANVFSLTTNIDKKENTAHVNLTLEVQDIEALSRLLDKLKQLPNVTEAKRTT